jgi:hypothetical protein
MKSLGSHLAKYTNLGAHKRSERDVCKKAISAILGVEVDEKALAIKQGILYTTLPAPLKAKVRENKREILTEIRKTLGRAVTDIG